ncbi:hypothetical protein BFL36_07215 [Clavibacter michiganensis]|uniref:Uncharacterized protein n=1 Tax=Clavibacter michiganensis TaxID=28447 RepID=A0A251YI89_9MICO|nr:hypothetical protein [Clavibacter michiganensis]OUE23829.1 hypothetical protein BFL36_07215 [Clavibacter michiganensis]
MSAPHPRSARARRAPLLLAGLFAVIAVANAVRAAVDPSAGASGVVAGLFGLGAVCFLASHLVDRRTRSRGGSR